MLSQYLDVFSSLNSRNVRYIVIGGVAAVLHGVPRATFDLDMTIDAEFDNASRLLEAFEEARLGTALLIDASQLLSQEVVIFKDRVRIDVQTITPGIDFEAAWLRREKFVVGNQEVNVLCLADLIKSKEAAGRKVDLEDVESLKAANEE